MRLFVSLIIFTAFCFTACAEQQQKPQQSTANKENERINEEHDWSGSASYVSRSSSKSSYNETYVAGESETFFEYRMNATLSRGYGNASSSANVKDRFKRTERMGGRSSTSETFVDGNASGSMSTDVVVEISDDGKSYSLFIPIPACTGKKIKRTTGAEPETMDMGEDEAMIQVEFQPMGDNPDVISGEIADKRVGDNGEITETILRWSLVRGPLDVELLVFPENLTSWLPVPGKDENTPGTEMNIGLKLQGKDGKKPKFKAKSFELKLIGTSIEPGVAINYPITVSGSKPDIRFNGDAAVNDGQEISIGSSDGETGSTTLASYDGGGYTILQAEAVLEGGMRVRGTLEVPTGVTDIEIPKRKKGAKIADAWLAANGNPAETSDNDKSMGNDNNGDGLTAYEEYRGVFSEGKYKRLNPKVKELGVNVKKEHIGALTPGLDLFSQASGVTVVKLVGDEMDSIRVFNKNKGTAGGGKQHVLLLLDARLDKGITGRNEPEMENGKTPATSKRTVIDLQQIRYYYDAQVEDAAKHKIPMPYTYEDELANTIAHELAHGVFVTHHGPNSVVIPRTAYRNRTPAYALYETDGTPMEIPEDGKALKLVGDNKGNESSGDLNCIIAYTTRYQWYFEQAADRTLVYRAVPLLPQGKIFCTSGKGTGINANGYFGDSKKGNCLSQIKVKDF